MQRAEGSRCFRNFQEWSKLGSREDVFHARVRIPAPLGRASERASPGEDKRLEGAPEDDESSSSFSFVSYTPSHATSVASPSRVSPHAGGSLEPADQGTMC